MLTLLTSLGLLTATFFAIFKHCVHTESTILRDDFSADMLFISGGQFSSFLLRQLSFFSVGIRNAIAHSNTSQVL